MVGGLLISPEQKEFSAVDSSWSLLVKGNDNYLVLDPHAIALGRSG